jgi:hypothetical protein
MISILVAVVVASAPVRSPLASFSAEGSQGTAKRRIPGLPWSLRTSMPSGLLSLLLEGFGHTDKAVVDGCPVHPGPFLARKINFFGTLEQDGRWHLLSVIGLPSTYGPRPLRAMGEAPVAPHDTLETA